MLYVCYAGCCNEHFNASIKFDKILSEKNNRLPDSFEFHKVH